MSLLILEPDGALLVPILWLASLEQSQLLKVERTRFEGN
jgi:hypothetical protein